MWMHYLFDEVLAFFAGKGAKHESSRILVVLQATNYRPLYCLVRKHYQLFTTNYLLSQHAFHHPRLYHR